ncbi:odorant receptor 67a [Drosophila tropicalis]|uniref:odorant receptor 67a n=1 Tax=Drosophila tropicalis TaxID=46794 RepID=UPI0035ABC542
MASILKHLKDRFLQSKLNKLHVDFNDFMWMPLFFYRTIGIKPFHSSTSNEKTSIWFTLYFVLHFVNLNFVLICEITFVWLAFRNSENFLDACMTMSYIGFVVVAGLKIIAVSAQKKKLQNLVLQIEAAFPPSDQVHQEKYDVVTYLRQCRWVSQGFGGLYVLLIVTYNLYAILQYVVPHYVFHSPDAQQIMPYVPTAPWNWHNNWKYYITYVMQGTAGYTATCGHISADLMIFAFVIQVIMHFNYLAKCLKEIEIKNGSTVEGSAGDMRKLQQLIAYHNNILGLTDVMNDVFGVPLLLNFMASSMVVCFVGFQMTVGLSPEQTSKLALLLISATSEIYLICYFSQALIDASFSISFAVYDMNWTPADGRFRKMLVLVAMRAQKPVCLSATVFLDVSMETMSMFLKMSYQFFCVIRTMYQ